MTVRKQRRKQAIYNNYNERVKVVLCPPLRAFYSSLTSLAHPRQVLSVRASLESNCIPKGNEPVL